MSNDQTFSAALCGLLDAGQRATDFDVEAATSAIAAWIRRRDNLLAEGTPADAYKAVGDLLTVVRGFAEPLLDRAFDGADNLGRQLLKNLGRPNDEGRRLEEIELLISKLRLASRFLDGKNTALPLQRAAFELSAISAGDDPHLFAPIQEKRSKGKGKNAYRLAVSQLRALEWSEVLSGRGYNPSDRNLHLHQAFGVQPDAMRKWREPCKARLGEQVFNNAILAAKAAGLAGELVFSETYGLSFADAIQLDGQQYRDELRRRKS